MFGSGAVPTALTVKTLYDWNANDALKNMVSVNDIDTSLPANPSDERVPSTALCFSVLGEIRQEFENTIGDINDILNTVNGVVI